MRLITDYLLSAATAARVGMAAEQTSQRMETAVTCSFCPSRTLERVRRCNFCGRTVCGSCQVVCLSCGEVFCRATCSTLSYQGCDAHPVCLDCHR